MALTGMFSNVVKDRSHRGSARRFILTEFITNPDYGVSASQSAEMAVIDRCPPSRQRQLLYVEWTEFTDSRSRIIKRKNADQTAHMLSASKTGMLLLPYYYGFVEDERNDTAWFSNLQNMCLRIFRACGRGASFQPNS